MQELLETLVCTPLVLGCLQPVVADKLVDFLEKSWNALSFSPVDCLISLAE